MLKHGPRFCRTRSGDIPEHWRIPAPLCQAVWRTHSVLRVDYVQVMEVDRSANADALLKHLEAALGSLDESRSVSESFLMAEDGAEFGVVAFGSRRPTTFATFGISRHLLSKASDAVSQELLVVVEDREFAVNLLSTVGRHVLDNHHALDAGERHRLPGWNEASAIAGVIAVPDPVVAHFGAGPPKIDFLRLLPITDAEAAYANERGWHELADKL